MRRNLRPSINSVTRFLSEQGFRKASYTRNGWVLVCDGYAVKSRANRVQITYRSSSASVAEESLRRIAATLSKRGYEIATIENALELKK